MSDYIKLVQQALENYHGSKTTRIKEAQVDYDCTMITILLESGKSFCFFLTDRKAIFQYGKRGNSRQYRKGVSNIKEN